MLNEKLYGIFCPLRFQWIAVCFYFEDLGSAAGPAELVGEQVGRGRPLAVSSNEADVKQVLKRC